MYHLRNLSNYKVVRQANFALDKSNLRHGITAWGNAKCNSKLRKSQNQLLRILWKACVNHKHYYNKQP